MKKIFLLGIFLFCGGLSVAYEFVPSAPQQVRPLTQEERQTDDNGDPMALLTVQSEIKGLIFDGAALPAEKTGQEYRVYVAQGTDRLFLRAPGVKALTWQVGELNPAFVYRATIGQKGHASQSKTQPKALLAENFRYELFDQEWVVLNKQNPNKYALLKDYNDHVADGKELHLEKLVPLGWGIFRWVNQFFVIPLFDFLGGFIDNYGWLIFIMTVIVKLILFPLTYKSYMSSAKMRVLRPQVEEINAQYPNQDQAMERQSKIMELYNRAGASPMSGCLPMLLQLPILVALFMFFPSAIELRHESFLWAEDLSTYDAIVSWNAQIPLISTYFGNHISLFCLLMTITQIVYTKYNMELTNTGQQQMPGMKMMMYLMPIMFMFIFNSYASGLTYYYFISTVITIAQTLFFRYTINEEKLLAKLEENKKRPMKKSGFMKRLEEAQRMQQEQLKRQQEQRQQLHEQRKAKRR